MERAERQEPPEPQPHHTTQHRTCLELELATYAHQPRLGKRQSSCLVVIFLFSHDHRSLRSAQWSMLSGLHLIYPVLTQALWIVASGYCIPL